MAFLSAFDDWSQQIPIYSISESYSSATGQVTKSEALVGTYKALFYQLSASQRYYYERLESNVSARLIIYPAIAPTLTDNMYAVVSGKKWYFVHPDDILSLGDSIEIDCARES